MFLILIGLLLLIIVLGIINKRNKYSFILIINLISVVLLLFWGTLYTIKIQHYTYITRMDYFLYLSIAEIKLPISSIRDLYNFSFALYMFSNIYAFKMLLNIKWRRIIWMCSFIILYAIINSASWTITVEVNQSNIFICFIKECQNIISVGILAGYSLLSFVASVIVYMRAKFRIKKRDIFTFGFCLAIITIYIYIIFVFGSFSKILFWNVNTIGLPKTEMAASSYLSVTILTFCMLVVAVMTLIMFKPFNLFTFAYNRKKDMLQESQFFNENLNSNLHMYKNMVCGAKQQFEIIKKAMEVGDYDSVIGYAEDGINMSDSNYEQIKQTMDAFSSDIMKIETVDIVECMENVLLKLPVTSKIKVKKSYQYPQIYTYGNKVILSEAFYNILINSIESFDKSKIQPYIDVKICTDENICMIEISDNGCGIPRKYLKKIFHPFYSTKNNTYNSGIGLNFVKKIVESYHGTIYVSSKPNKYTSFQLTIPYVRYQK